MTGALGVMDRPPRWRPVLLVLSLLSSSVLLGTSLPPTSLDQLIHDADLIVRGTVEAVTPGPQRDGALSTAVRVSVQEQWKGRRRSRLRLLLPRGTEGGITQEVPGAPTFQIGEEVILFVVLEAPGQYRVLGGKQGKFSIKTDPRSGQRVVEDLTGTRFDFTPFLRRLSKGP